MEKFYDSKAMRKRLGISEATLTRWSQDDESGFPKPLQYKHRGKRLWSESSLRLWIERNQSKPPPPEIESASEHSKRYRAAMESLAQQGIKTNNSNRTKGDQQ